VQVKGVNPILSNILGSRHNGVRTKSWTLIETRKGVIISVFKISAIKALQLYDQCKSVGNVIQQLGYPSRKRLYDWIAQRNA